MCLFNALNGLKINLRNGVSYCTTAGLKPLPPHVIVAANSSTFFEKHHILDFRLYPAHNRA